MPESEPVAGIPWLLWRATRPVRAPHTRAPIWLRTRRATLARVGGLWVALRPGRGVPLLAPVDHPIPILAISTAGLARTVLQVDSTLPVAEGEVPRLAPAAERLRVQRRLPAGRARDWAGRWLRRARRRPGRPALPPDLGRPVVPGPSFGSPPDSPATPAPLAGVDLPPAPGVPRPVSVPRCYDGEFGATPRRARRKTT